MGIFSRFEGRMEDGIEGAANKMFDAPISPVQIAKKAEKAMRREKMVGAGRQYAPTLYTVLVNPDDDQRLFGYYPTLAGETETYLAAKAQEEGLAMDGQPLVRFIVDDELRHGKFDIIAEMVSAPIIAQLRQEEMARYGLAAPHSQPQPAYAPLRPQSAPAQQQFAQAQGGYDPLESQAAPAPAQQPHEPLPYVPEEEIDRSIDYGEYTFNSQDWDSYEDGSNVGGYTPQNAARETFGRRNSQPFDNAHAAPRMPQADLSGLDVESYNVGQPGIAQAFAGTPVPQDVPPAQAPATALMGQSPQGQGGVQGQGAEFMPAMLIDTATNRSHLLNKDRLILGRSSASDVILDDINASRSHAEIRYEPQGYWAITDLGSTNGTYVNGRRIGTEPLNEGDQISAGMTNLVFTLR